MRYLLAAVTIVGSLAGSAAFSQTTADEAQRRRAHLPSIRAATDCIAREVLREPLVIEAVQQNRLYDILQAPMQRCLAEIRFMIAEHDRLYGWGTGQPFFQGAYYQDIGRAITTRIRPEIDRRVAEAARIEADRQTQVARVEAQRRERITAAEAAAGLLRDRMYDCANKELAGLVASSESASVLTSAAMTLCHSQIDATVDAYVEVMLLRFPDLPPADFAKHRSDLRNATRERIMASAVQARAAVASTSAGSSAASRPAAVTPSTTISASGVRTCLQSASTLREGKIVPQDDLVKTMLDLCRPEIESAARSAFFAEPSLTLDKARENALTQAVADAKAIVGVTR